MDTDTDENETATTVDDSLDEDTPEEGYYDHPEDIECVSSTATDPEAFKYDILRISDVDRLLNEQVQQVSEATGIQPAIAKVLLKHHHWQTAEVIERMHNDAMRTLIEARVEPKSNLSVTQSLATALNNNNAPSAITNAASSRHTHGYGLRSKKSSGDEATSSATQVLSTTSTRCGVCYSSDELLRGLRCGHRYCTICWETHFGVKLERGVASGLECMHLNCDLLCPEDFVLSALTRSAARERYLTLCSRDYVESHPRLRYCPGADCDAVALAQEPLARRVVCNRCRSSFCFRCGSEYHAPTECATIQKWLKKCRDDSETYNYICANTKDCPACHVCIEKNGGCNHMMCSKCRHEFCWICLGDWKSHGTEYYECSRYRGKEHGDSNSASATAREALTKYLFYYTRWDNHGNSLKLEAQFLRRIRDRIDEKVSKQEGTWIDWQPLINAAELLQRSRYTLRYTYPYAYYLERGSTKELFEMRQAQLEREVEELAWKIEHAEITDRGDLQNQMNITEKRRLTLLTDFLQK